MTRHQPKPKIDRDALHRLWWNRAERGHALEIVATEFAEEAHYSHHTISRIIREMVADGRLRKVGKTRYIVSDPYADKPKGTPEVKLVPRTNEGVQWE